MRLLRILAFAGVLVLLSAARGQSPGVITESTVTTKTIRATAGNLVCAIGNQQAPKIQVDCTDTTAPARKFTVVMEGSSGLWTNGADTISWSLNVTSWSVTANGVTKSGNF